MRFHDLRDIDREAVSDFIWRWRCKVFPSKEAAASKALNVDDDATDLKAAAVSGKDPAFGTEPIIKTMYEGKNSSSCHFDWVDYPPKQLSRSAARAQDRVALKVYKIKDRDKPCIGGRFPLKYQEVEVQNLTLVAALEPVLKKENIHLDVNEPARFKHPFRGLWFCQDDIIELHQRTEASDPLKSYLKLLIRIALHVTGKDVERHNIEGRILIDVVGYNKYHLARGKRENQDPLTKRNGFRLFDLLDPSTFPDYDSEDSSDDDESEAGSRAKRLGDKDF